MRCKFYPVGRVPMFSHNSIAVVVAAPTATVTLAYHTAADAAISPTTTMVVNSNQEIVVPPDDCPMCDAGIPKASYGIVLNGEDKGKVINIPRSLYIKLRDAVSNMRLNK